MKFDIKKIDGTNKCYIMANGDCVPFGDYKSYKVKKIAENEWVKKQNKTVKPEYKKTKRSY